MNALIKSLYILLEMKLNTLFLVILIAIGIRPVLNAADTQATLFNTMSYKDVLPVTIEADFAAIKSGKKEAKTYDGTISYKNANGEEIEWNMELEIRGRYRRLFSQGVPPLKLNFKKKDLSAAGLAKYDDMKLVTMFHADKSIAFQTLVKEYLVYKMYNVLSDLSFRVQFVEINYIDTSTGKAELEYGFLIEDNAELADRLNLEKYNQSEDKSRVSFDDNHNEFVAMFQYMIGNGDYSIESPKNVKLFINDDKIVAIPYDFDFSGIVDASYAVPNNMYGRRTVKDRVYLGKKDSILTLEHLLEKFEEKESELMAILENNRLLSRKNRLVTSSYLASFYDEITYRKANHSTIKEPIVLERTTK